jgi:hypothetical protein
MCVVCMEIYCIRSQCNKWSSKRTDGSFESHTNTDNLIIFSNWTFKFMINLLKFLIHSGIQSAAVADAAYSVQWYNHSTKFKKMIQMVIMRAQRPCLIHMGPTFPLSMEQFQTVSQISFYNSWYFYKFCINCRTTNTGSKNSHSENSSKLRVENYCT